MGLTDYSEEALLNFWFCGEDATPPSALYIGLLTAEPDEDGTVVEVSGFAYARQAVTFELWSADVGESGGLESTADVTYPEATGSWGTVTHGGIFDAPTGGNLLAYGALTASRSIGDGEIFTFPVGTAIVTLD